MCKLTGLEIVRMMEKGKIVIHPFNVKRINPESYNLTLADTLLVYEGKRLDMKRDNPTREIKIPKEGFELQPGELYLAMTNEYTETYDLHPVITGRSSTARLGLFTHITAGQGDNGFKGNWTLELCCIKPLKIYAGEEICQIYYETLKGDKSLKYKGKYNNNGRIMSSQIFKEIRE
jgi:dCTP deaminase